MANNFVLGKCFLKIFSELNEAFEKQVKELKSFDASKYEYGVCSSSYKMRFITPANINTYIDMLAKAFEKHMLSTVSDVETFSVEAAIRALEENGSDSFISAMPSYYTPNVDTLKTLSDILSGIRLDCYNRSAYSQFDLRQRHANVIKEVSKIEELHFYNSMKTLVNSGIPTVLGANSVVQGLSEEDKELFAYGVETYILFAYSVNMLTLENMRQYLVPKQTYNERELSDQVVTECCHLKTIRTTVETRIPFSINMRNMVIMDNSTDLCDIKNALSFIVDNPRSPFNQLILRFTDFNKDVNTNCHLLDRIITPCFGRCCDQNSVVRHDGWLDGIVRGNCFIDGAYRRDVVVTGNNTQHSVIDALDMIYKMYNGCGCEETSSNVELSNNIIRVKKAMEHVVDRYASHENRQLVKDILALLGEIMTRDLIMLYDNCTQVLDYGVDSDNTFVPAFTYTTESYVMESYFSEADGQQPQNANGGNVQQPQQQNAQQQPQQPQQNTNASTTNANDKNKASVTVAGKNGREKEIRDNFRRFITFIKNVLAGIAKKFVTDHTSELEYINKNDKPGKNNEPSVHKQIEDACGSSFRINVNNIPKHNISIEQLKPHIDEAVTKALSTKGNIDLEQFEASLYPGSPEQQKEIVAERDIKKKAEMVGNLIFFGKTKTTNEDFYTGELTAEIFRNDFVDQLKNMPKLLETEVSNLVQDLNNATSKVQNVSERELKEDTQPDDPVAIEVNNAKQIRDVMMNLSQVYTNTVINKLMRNGFSDRYMLYAKIIKAYIRQRGAAQNTQQKVDATGGNNDAGENNTAPAENNVQ